MSAAKNLQDDQDLQSLQERVAALSAELSELDNGDNEFGSPSADEGEGNWLISYADMMTLLVGFFVMLLSFSKMDMDQYEKVKQETSKVFGGEYQVPFGELAEGLEGAIKEKGLGEQVIVHKNESGVTVTFRGALFFDSGSVYMKDQALDLLAQLAPVVSDKASGYGILIEGHTDDNPIASGLIASNWELSSLRASTVLRFFLEKGFNPQRLKAIGLAETQPILPNRDSNGQVISENQSQNRRVVLKILRDFD